MRKYTPGTPERKQDSKQDWKPGNMLYPLPAVMVSLARPGEKPNIITIAWCGTVCTDPAMAALSIKPERYSYDILKETGECVINLTTRRLVRAADFCGVRSGRDTDKFRETGLTPVSSRHVSAPAIAESPVNIECRVEKILPLGSHHLFLVRILGVSVAEELLDEAGRLRLERAHLAAYSHGLYYELGKELGSFGYSVRKSSGSRRKH